MGVSETVRERDRGCYRLHSIHQEGVPVEHELHERFVRLPKVNHVKFWGKWTMSTLGESTVIIGRKRRTNKRKRGEKKTKNNWNTKEDEEAKSTAVFKGIFLIQLKCVVHGPYGRQYHTNIGGFLRTRLRIFGPMQDQNPMVADRVGLQHRQQQTSKP